MPEYLSQSTRIPAPAAPEPHAPHGPPHRQFALDYIGDVDLAMGQKYLKRRDERLDEAAAVFDERADPRNRHQTITERSNVWDSDSEDAGELELVELGREDSNLQLPG